MDKLNRIKNIMSAGSSIKRHSLDDLDASDLISEPAVAHFKTPNSSCGAYVTDPRCDREMIDSIEANYFIEEENDGNGLRICRKELLSHVERMDSEEMRVRCEILKRQHKAVAKRVSELVLQNHPAYARELERVQELEATLQNGCLVAASARRHLNASHRSTVRPSLQLLSHCRKRHKLATLLCALKTIKTLQVTDQRLRELLAEQNFAGAIQLCLECQQVATTYQQFRCVNELSAKLQDTLVMTEEALDVALAKTTSHFSAAHYSKLQAAYSLLGKRQSALDQLHMHFTSAIHNTAFHIVLGYVQLGSGGGHAGELSKNMVNDTIIDAENSCFQKRQYADLCRLVGKDMFTPCLMDLCKALWGIILSYHQAMQWHANDSSLTDTTAGGAVAAAASVDSQFERTYVNQKLQQGPLRMWQDVQAKVRLLVDAVDLADFRFEAVIRVMDIVSRLVRVGREFCGSLSEALEETLRKQILSYFRLYHKDRLEHLRMFLECEGWHPVFVKASFSCLDLIEYRALRQRLRQQPQQQLQEYENQVESSSVTDDLPVFVSVVTADAVEEDNADETVLNFFSTDRNPFDFPVDEDGFEDILEEENDKQKDEDGVLDSTGSVDSDEDSVLNATQIDEESGRPVLRHNSFGSSTRYRRVRRLRSIGQQPPLIANATVEVLRLCGRYMQMIHLLRPIAFDVMSSMIQLVEYYFYTVYWFFGSDKHELVQASITPRLKQALSRISEALLLPVGTGATSHLEAASGGPVEKVSRPTLNATINLASLDTLQGLSERILGIASLEYLAEQVRSYLLPVLEPLLGEERFPFLTRFQSHTLAVCSDLRLTCHCAVAARSIDWDRIGQLMLRVDWGVQDILTQHNSYVDVIIQELVLFSERLATIDRRLFPGGNPDTWQGLWHYVTLCAARTFVEGFSGARRCTTEGRALMQLDFRQYLLQLERLTSLRPIPHRDYVDGFIKAYYLPSDQFVAWLKKEPGLRAQGFNTRQVIALVACMSHLQKRERQEILTLLDGQQFQEQQKTASS